MENLKDFFKEHGEIAIAFSGGTDSSYLMYVAKKYAKRVKAYYVNAEFQPAFELEDAEKLAKELDVDMEIINLEVLSNLVVKSNPHDRCYHCKNQIFSNILAHAKQDGFTEIIDGTNASDDEGDRPGMKALKEMKVLSPLRICGITKKMVRDFSKEANLFTWDKPSYACLATRIPTGTEIDKLTLDKVERAENYLFSLGFKDFRVRIFNKAALIQVHKSQILKFYDKKDEILIEMKNYFDRIFLDLEER